MDPAPSVVLADDEHGIRKLLEYTFERAGYETELYASGDDCWKRLQTGAPPDLVVLDCMLPGMDGIDVLKRIRSDAALSDTPVVFVTGRGDRADVIDDDVTVDDYITKPFSPNALCERVEQLV